MDMRGDNDRTPDRRDRLGQDRASSSDETMAGQGTARRYTVNEAALMLGLSVDAVRKRVERGRLQREKAPDGTAYILLDPEVPAGPEASRLAKRDETLTGQDALVKSLQDQIEYLRRELDIGNEELRRKDQLLSTLLERILGLEVSGETTPEDDIPDEDVWASRASSGLDGEDVAETGATTSDTREPERRRSWLYRFF